MPKGTPYTVLLEGQFAVQLDCSQLPDERCCDIDQKEEPHAHFLILGVTTYVVIVRSYKLIKIVLAVCHFAGLTRAFGRSLAIDALEKSNIELPKDETEEDLSWWNEVANPDPFEEGLGPTERQVRARRIITLIYKQ